MHGNSVASRLGLLHQAANHPLPSYAFFSLKQGRRLPLGATGISCGNHLTGTRRRETGLIKPTPFEKSCPAAAKRARLMDGLREVK